MVFLLIVVGITVGVRERVDIVEGGERKRKGSYGNKI